MIRTRFSSHAQQVAALGSAAVIDPVKFPRRFDHDRARARFDRGLTGVRKMDAYLRRKALAERAVFHTDLSMREAARLLGCTFDTLKTTAGEFGLKFNMALDDDGSGTQRALSERRAIAAKSRRSALADKAREHSDKTRRDAAKAMGVSYDVLRKLAAEFGLKFKSAHIGRPREQRQKGKA